MVLRKLKLELNLKFLYNIQGRPKLNGPKFSGIIYSGIQNKETIIKTINYFRKSNQKVYEILIHPGHSGLKERREFKENYFNFYNSKNRKEEFNLCFSKKIKMELRLFAKTVW